MPEPFRSIVVRAVETVYAGGGGAAHHRRLRAPAAAVRRCGTTPGVGHGWSEAPADCSTTATGSTRSGKVASALIVPPTSQNQAAIEADLASVVAAGVELDDGADGAVRA